jgi:integrase
MEDADQARLLTFLLDPNNRLEVWWEEERRARKEAKRRGQDRTNQKPPRYLVRTPISQALLLLFISGLRSWEVLALRWDEIHQRSKSISVEQTKRGANPSSTADTKRIFISEEVQEVLDQIPETSEWVFPSSGRSIKPQSGHIENLQDSWERIRTHLGIPAKIRLHDYRHTAASEIGDSDSVSVKDLMAIFGWKSEQTAMRYLHSRAQARDQRVQDITTQRMARLGELKMSAGAVKPREVHLPPHRVKVPSMKEVKAIHGFAADQLPTKLKAPEHSKGQKRIRKTAGGTIDKSKKRA